MSNPPQGHPFARIKTGQYSGDGTESKAITGVGFRPIFVKIWIHHTSDAAQYMHERTAIMDRATAHTCAAGAEHISRDARITSLDADGFTVSDDGGDIDPNKDGRPYNYLCMGL